MQNSRVEQSLVGQDHVLSTSREDQGRSVLEEELSWARLERQKVLALSAEADEAIWSLAALARRTMQERDEARNQARMLLADLQARNAQMMMLPGTPCPRVARPDAAFTATGYRQQALAPTAAAFRPLGDSVLQGQRYARIGAGHCVASSSGFGHMSFSSSLEAYTVQPSTLHAFASSSQDHFDPDMFLVDAAESLQDVVPATEGSSKGEVPVRMVRWQSRSPCSCSGEVNQLRLLCFVELQAMAMLPSVWDVALFAAQRIKVVQEAEFSHSSQ